ncbi:MAG: hypothetical protein Unbinned3585contig1000_15 [Prokaryotic dsDNA virus sp.]|jgi:hypothetical protein|nr:MAG: hypothetical protein Unbinned3585contig1000_15 [Prokaryotic dsDNA virus sp.]|tara:strand:+ start:8099 stop:8542 length:444 start_codon:yes stop_codon:yes gene_type:complete
MSNASNYTEDRTLDFWLKNNSASSTSPSTVFLALFTSTDSTGGTAENLEAGILSNEVTTSGTAYVRQSIAFGTISNGSVASSGTVTYATATANYGTVTHVAIMDTNSTSDSAGAGNVLFYGALTSAKTIESGDTFQIQAGSLTVSLA